MRSKGRKLHDNLIEVYGSMIMRVKAKLEATEFVPDCLVKTLIQSQEKEKLDWEDLCMLSAAFTLGGVHSVSFLFMTAPFEVPYGLLDLWNNSVVPRTYPFSPRGGSARSTRVGSGSRT